STASVLSMLEAILHAEVSADVIARALATTPAVFDALLASGNWSALNGTLSALERAGDANPAFELTHRLIAQRVIDSLNLPDRAAASERRCRAGDRLCLRCRCRSASACDAAARFVALHRDVGAVEATLERGFDRAVARGQAHSLSGAARFGGERDGPVFPRA